MRRNVTPACEGGTSQGAFQSGFVFFVRTGKHIHLWWHVCPCTLTPLPGDCDARTPQAAVQCGRREGSNGSEPPNN
eukprot:gene7831-biopygen12092